MNLRLRCPRCGEGEPDPQCAACGFSIEARDGILRALPEESLSHHDAFVDAYQRIRAAEGRGGDDSAFYLGLPWHDASGRDPAQWRMRGRSYDYVVRHLLQDASRPLDVLDLGAGNCWMSYRLALAGHRPCAVDLVTNGSDGMGAARHYRARIPALFPRFHASFGCLPFADAQFDAAVFNASFHYSEDAEGVLREALRSLRPDGVAIIVDTPWYPREEDGRRMLAERRAAFLQRHGTAGNPLPMLGFLTDARLQRMASALSVRWETHRPWYGWRWALRPLAAKLRGRRAPSRFRVHVAHRRG